MGARWTPAEDAELRRLYSTETCEQIGERLGRTRLAVTHRASVLGLQKRRHWWSEAEDAALRENYGEHPPSWSGWGDALPGTTRQQRYVRALQLGIIKRSEKHAWTDAEDKRLLHAVLDMAAEINVNAALCVSHLRQMDERGML